MKLVVLSISLFFVMSFMTATQITQKPSYETERDLIESSRILSPGVQYGETDYDWQPNGSMGRYTLLPSGGIQFAWTCRHDGNNATRCIYYNYHYPPSYWLGPTIFIEAQSIASGLNHMGGGRALITGNVLVGNDWWPLMCIDEAEGAGSFILIDLPAPPNPLDPILWPLPCVDAEDNIFISGTSEDGLYITKSTTEGCSWSDWILVDSTGGHESWATYSGKTALVYSAGTDFENVYYWETTDNGVNWTTDTVFIPLPQDSVVGYIWNSAVYDNNGYVHIVFNCIDTTQAGQGGPNFSGCRSQIRHWNQQSGQFSIVATGWWILEPGPGSIHPTVSECQIAIDRATGTLYCTWCQADSGDVAANGYTNLEIYGAYSTDNGASWSMPVNITNSQSPGATAGYCENDCWQSIAMYGDTICIFYMNDKDAGSSVYGEGTFTVNSLLVYPYPFSVGVEEQIAKMPLGRMFHIAPNPVSQSVNISYTLPYAACVSLKLYSVDGRLVKAMPSVNREAGSHTEHIDLSALANGTYFIILDTPTCKRSCPIIVIH